MPYFNNFSFLRPDDEEEYGFQSPYRGLLDQPAITVPKPVPEQGMRNIYQELINQPETQEHQAYLNWIKNTPKESDYQPSKGTRLAAVLAGAGQGFLGDIQGGMQTGSMINRGSYERALRQHEIEGRGLREVAMLKRQSLEDRMQLLARMETSRVAQQNYELQRENITSQIANRQITAEQARLNIEKTKKELEMLGFHKVVDKENGTEYYRNPFNGATTTPVKIDESIKEAETRGRATFTFQEGQRRTTQAIQREDTQAFTTEENEKTRTQRKELSDAALKMREKIAKERQANQNRVPSVQRNIDAMLAATLTNTEKYPIDELFDKQDDGSLRLKNIEDVEEKYQQAWRDLFNLRFKGISPELAPMNKEPDIDFDKEK